MFKLLVVILIVGATIVDGCPNIKGRSEWGAASPKKTKRIGQVPYVLIHHTDTGQCNTASACAAQVKSIQNFHMGPKKQWDDIGYNFLIDQFGNIYEGRGWGISGAHSPNYNSKSVGISFIGNYQSANPSSASIQAAKSLIQCGVSNGKLSSSYKVLGHRQTKMTDCPGDKLYEEIKTWPRWSSSP